MRKRRENQVTFNIQGPFYFGQDSGGVVHGEPLDVQSVEVIPVVSTRDSVVIEIKGTEVS